MGKVIKEIIIMLLICLVGMLLFAVLFYQYIPNRKVVAEVKEYQASTEVDQLLEDNIDQEKNEVVLTYSVTSSDLSNYEATNNYNPGKANPFSAPTTTSSKKNNTNSNGNSSNSKNNSANSGNSDGSNNSSSNSDSNSSYISENGTK